MSCLLPLLVLSVSSPSLAKTHVDKWLGGADKVEISDVVEVPLYLGPGGDELPYIEVKFGEKAEHSNIFRLDLGGSDLVMSCPEAKNEGLKVKTHNMNFWKSLGRKGDKKVPREGGKRQTVSMAEVDLAAGLVLKGVTMSCSGVGQNPLDPSDPLAMVSGIIGVGALHLAAAVVPSKGVVRFAPADKADALLSGIGKAVPLSPVPSEFVNTGAGNEFHGPAAGAVAAKVGGTEVKLGISTSDLTGRLPSNALSADPPAFRVGDLDVVWAPATIGTETLVPNWYLHANLYTMPATGIDGLIGHGVLRDYDLAVDPVAGRLAFARATPAERKQSLPLYLARLDASLKKMAEPPKDGATPTEEQEKAKAKGQAGILAERALVLERSGDFAGAIANLTESAKLNPDPCTTWKQLGQAYWQTGQNADATTSLQKALDLYTAWSSQPLKERTRISALKEDEQHSLGRIPQDLDACESVASELALIQLAQGDRKAVLQGEKKYLDLNPDLPLAAAVAELADGHLAEASGLLHASINLATSRGERALGSHSLSLLGLAFTEAKGNDLAAAMATWEKANFVLAYDPAALHFYANTVKTARGDAATVKALETLGAHFPDSPAILTTLGVQYRGMGREADATRAFGAAMTLYDHSLALEPTVAANWGLRALHLALVGDSAGARASAEKALKLSPSDIYALLAFYKAAAAEAAPAIAKAQVLVDAATKSMTAAQADLAAAEKLKGKAKDTKKAAATAALAKAQAQKTAADHEMAVADATRLAAEGKLHAALAFGGLNLALPGMK
jgi:tetratricopeptide (TPR) repeat protein